MVFEDIGDEVHAGCELRKRWIWLHTSLRSSPTEYRRILTHELFHFAWIRLGNATRASYAALLAREFEQGARGELGWSAEHRKIALKQVEAAQRNPRLWREYVCESFCDTAAWLYSGVTEHAEFTLAKRFRERRARWFSEYYRDRKLSI